MARLIGMDEAGLGPNFGPLVVAITVWDVPEHPRQFDFWQAFNDVLTNAPKPEDVRLHVADSKKVFQPHRGFGALERGVLAAMRLIGHLPNSYHELCQLLQSVAHIGHDSEWYQESHFELPAENHDFALVDAWQRSCDRQGIKLVAIKAAIVEPQQFNRLIREYDNKSLLVSRVAFALLRSVWSPDETEAFVVGDKHGGRNRYDELLAEVLDGEMIFRLEEGAERSDYRVGRTVLRFQPRAEEHGPVALASMTAKYVRELAMSQFNRFWARHITGLKPTQGYPLDAKRFRADISAVQQQLNISDEVLWRCR